MNKQLLRFTLYTIITYLTSSEFNPAIVASQPSWGNGTHFCGVTDAQSDQRYLDQYPNRRYARTAAANLDVGEPRTVRMIYFLPNDRPYRADVVQKMKDEIRTVQNFFADQMGAHGYGNKTFRLETDSQGTPLVHRVDGQYPDSHYLYRTEDTVFAEIERKFDVMQNIYSIVIDNSINEIRWGEGRRAIGFGGRRGKNGGLVLHSGEFGWQTLAHHMGHGFGLWHDFSDGAYIMSYGPGWNRLSPYYTEYLSVHPYFNPEIPLEAGQTSTMEFISPRTYPAGSENVSIRLKVSDSEGLYQVLLLLRTGLGHPGAGSIEVKAGRGFMGEKDAIVEFDYDGVTPSDKFTSLSNPAAHRIHVQTVDTAGNVSQEYFVLAEISPYHIASLEGHTGAVHSMSFSSDGKTLASGAYDNMVKLWNVELGTNIAIFPGGRSMSFSSDGTTLASAWKDTVKLWDVTTQQVIATLSHTSFVHSVSFSSNGGMLASGLEDGTVQLWDVEKKENTATLEGHTDRVHSVSFSADGTLLVSGSDDNRIKLWDIKTKENITTLEGHTAGFHSVVFSPDGRTLASGSSNRTVKLWDVATESNFATLEGHLSWISSVSFSSDGVILASAGGWDNTINLWDVTTGASFATLGYTSGFHSVSFSDDGRILAAGTKEGTVELWDTSGWLEARLEVVVEIDIPDSDLRAAIATALGAPVGVSIVRGHLENLTRLKASNANISDLTGLEFATNLTTLELGPERVANEWRNSNAVKDLSPLAGLSYLTSLHLPNNSISDISAVANLHHLTWLHLSHNNISDLSPLVANTGLGKGDKVYVRGNPLSHLSVHTHIPALQSRGVTVEFDNRTPTTLLNISGVITELDNLLIVEVRDGNGLPFAGVPVTFTITSGGGTLSTTRTTTDENGRTESRFTLDSVEGTNTVRASVEGISKSVTFSNVAADIPDLNLRAAVETALSKAEGEPIAPSEMAALTRLEASEAGVRNLTGLEHATNLTYLDFWKSLVSDISPVAGLTNLTHLGFAANNVISDISALAGLTNLTALWVNGNNISDISPLAGLTKLSRLGLDNNNISDISALAGLTNLSLLNLRSNSILDISPLANLTKLTKLRLGGNSVSDISVVAGLTQLTRLSLWANSISDISPVTGLTNLTELNLSGNSISSIASVAGLTQLTWLHLQSNRISDIAALAGLTNLTALRLDRNSISDISALSSLTHLTELRLNRNNITDLSPLVANTGLGSGDEVDVTGNPLSYQSIHTHIPALQSRGVTVEFDNRSHPAFLKILGDNQNGASFAPLSQPFVVEAQDANGSALAGVSVTFAVTAGGGTLNTTLTRTDENGRAQSTLTLGPNLGTNTVSVSAAGIEVSVTFYAISDTESPPITADVNNDGSVNILDLILIASDLGNAGTNLAADVNRDGVVSILDLVLVAGMFDGAAAAPSVQPQVPETLTAVEVQGWLTDARALEVRDSIVKRGFLVLEQLLVSLTPRETELLANYPNPFNPETWIPYRLAEDASVTLTIYDLSGQVVRTLQVGHRIASAYENRSKAIYWDGRNDVGERVASGIYFYTLIAGNFSATRKMAILK